MKSKSVLGCYLKDILNIKKYDFEPLKYISDPGDCLYVYNQVRSQYEKYKMNKKWQKTKKSIELELGVDVPTIAETLLLYRKTNKIFIGDNNDRKIIGRYLPENQETVKKYIMSNKL